ncbi:MAG: hypothetical protein KBT58_00925 [Bizionia sp.]|nr:hypothetical protein [Bizionia sp.]
MKHIKKIIVPVLFVLVTFISFAQNIAPPAPDQPQSLGPGTGPPGLPIDSGLILLLVVAVIYGVYKVVKFKKTQ